jgi:triosephosphate isomerase
MRKPLVVGNWKMNTATLDEAHSLATSVAIAVAEMTTRVEVVLCPPFPWLTEVSRVIGGSSIRSGAQNMHPEPGGAFTGEVSPRMLQGLCDYVLVGQYERRILFSEKDAMVRRKLQVAQQHGLKPILCVGENADQLDEGIGPYVVAEQLEADLEGVTIDSRLVVAYDPAWTTMGRVAPPPITYVAEIIEGIRETLSSLYSAAAGTDVRIIYGGAVNPRTIADIAAQPQIDGVLAGTASMNAENFSSLVRAFIRS